MYVKRTIRKVTITQESCKIFQKHYLPEYQKHLTVNNFSYNNATVIFSIRKQLFISTIPRFQYI